MSKNMSIDELRTLMNYVYNHHSPFYAKQGAQIIKYVDPHIDMRTGECFSVTFRMYHGERSFYTTNEFRDAEPLYIRIMHWLVTGEEYAT
jgi:hypothetical protein